VTLTAAAVAFINAILALVTNFGVDLSDNQKAAITGLVNAAIVFGTLVWDTLSKRTMKPPPAGSATNGP
jgi:hypothetical protein